MSDFSKELEIASRLARQAGSAILQIYAQDFAVTYKDVNDPVTNADKRANAIIVEGLHEAFPQDTLVAEESPPPSHPVGVGRVWYVDPLDGTKEFIAKNGEFSVMIGLTIDGRTKCGVVYWPTQGELFVGIIGRGAWKESRGQRNDLKATHATQPGSLSLVSSRSHRSALLDPVKKALNIQHEHGMGSVGLKIAHIAQGGADLYMEPGPYTRSWDACAPEAVLRGAGGSFTDVHGRPIEYGEHDFRNVHGLLAATADCHARVIQAVNPLCSFCNG